MKKIFIYIGFVATGISTIMSCKKAGDDGTAPGPDITYVTSGNFCTIGIGKNYDSDTLVVFPTDAYNDVRVYAYGFTPAAEEVQITNNSNGTVSVKLKTPYSSSYGIYTHLGVFGSNFPLGTATYYRYDLKKETSAETEFILRRNASNGKKFTLESKAAPGYFMSTVHPGVQYQPNSTVETQLVFSSKRQEFFFLPK